MEASGHPGFERQSSQGRLLHSSPLDTLVRRTPSSPSQRWWARKHNSQASASIIPPPLQPHRAPPQAVPVSPPRSSASQHDPDSPLLHSNFRISTAGPATNAAALRTSWQNSKSFLSFTDDYEADDGCHEENNNISYGHHRPQPSESESGGHNYNGYSAATTTHLDTDLWPHAGLTQPTASNYIDLEDSMQSPPSPLPTVVVSSPQDDTPWSNSPMRQPIVSQGDQPRLNFSRPGRPPIVSSEEQKRRVLERNAQRTNSPRMSPSSVSFRPITPVTGIYPGNPHTSGHLASSELFSPSSTSSYLHPDGIHSTPSLASPNHIALPSYPPSFRAASPSSLYSNSYSFYQFDSALPSPTIQSPRHSPDVSPPSSRSVSAEPQTPEEYLQLGIQYHEANQLRDSALCFEKSAKEQGGCCVGMLMWGLTLRHGWGCEKNEKGGFKWLTKAAESAVEDLEKARKGLDVKGVKVSPCMLSRSAPSYATTGRARACYI